MHMRRVGHRKCTRKPMIDLHDAPHKFQNSIENIDPESKPGDIIVLLELIIREESLTVVGMLKSNWFHQVA